MSLAAVDFDFVSELVRTRAAIVLEPSKEYLVSSRLEPVARSAGFTTVAELIARLRTSTTSPLHEEVVDAMTTNETSFFRDVHPFESLRRSVLPDLIERRRARRSLSIWCAACSSGQEPYSVGMVIREHFPELASWSVRILATDLSPRMVQRTREGTFSQLEVNRGLPAPMLLKHFVQQGARWQVAPELRAMVRVQPLNLAAPWPAMTPVDLLMMRNVLIYFDVDTKRAILDRAHRVLAPDGYLLLGGAETTLNLDERFQRVGLDRTTWYRRGDG